MVRTEAVLVLTVYVMWLITCSQDGCRLMEELGGEAYKELYIEHKGTVQTRGKGRHSRIAFGL